MDDLLKIRLTVQMEKIETIENRIRDYHNAL